MTGNKESNNPHVSETMETRRQKEKAKFKVPKEKKTSIMNSAPSEKVFR